MIQQYEAIMQSDNIQVSDEQKIELILDQMQKPENSRGMIFDSFPNTINQAVKLDQILK